MGSRNLVGSAVFLGFERSVAALPARKARYRIFELPNDPEVSVVPLRFDRRIAALPARIKAHRGFRRFSAAGSAPACRARLQVWARTPRLRMGSYDYIGSVILLGFNRSFAALLACLEARRSWFPALAPAGACHVRLKADDRVFKFSDADFRPGNAQGRPLFLNLQPKGEAGSLIHDGPYLEGVVTGFLYFLRQSCVVIGHLADFA